MLVALYWPSKPFLIAKKILLPAAAIVALFQPFMNFDSNAQGAGSPRRDNKVVEILEKAELASGWNKQLIDVTATYTETQASSPTSSISPTFTLEEMSDHRKRLSIGQSSLVINGHSGMVKDNSGKSRAIAERSFQNVIPPLLPMFTDFEDWRHANSRLLYLGNYKAGEDIVDVVRIEQPTAGGAIPPDPSQAAIFRFSRLTGLPVSISVLEAAPNMPMALNRTSYEWSDYHLVGTVMVPGTVTKKMSSTPLATFSLKDVRFNTGLVDTIFALSQTH